MTENRAYEQARWIVERCADCDECRYLMADCCLFFPRLYQLHDREKQGGAPIAEQELMALLELCNFCALCPCEDIRTAILAAKTARVQTAGLSLGIRLMANPRRAAKICGAYPGLTCWISEKSPARSLVKKAAGIHADRAIPRFCRADIRDWPGVQGADPRQPGEKGQKVVLFAGCTSQYLFPRVAEAAISFLADQGIAVHVPRQRCCGMPAMLEGDRDLATRLARYNLDRLSRAVSEGYPILCTCPTCGYMLKFILAQGAYYSPQYQASCEKRPGYMKIPAPSRSDGQGFTWVPKSVYQNILMDNGYFSHLDPLKRIQVAENTRDLGEYLFGLHQAGELKANWGAVGKRAVYYPPCHQREQQMGFPYSELLARVPGLRLESVNSAFYCCGMGGIMGFKRTFHSAALRMGAPLMERIKASAPDMILTDCLSCRLQFEQMADLTVAHPIEILRQSHEKGKKQGDLTGF